MIRDPFSYSARWDSIGLDCAFCKFFSGPLTWPDSNREVFCDRHKVSLKFRLSKENSLDGEWFCKQFEDAGRASPKAAQEFEAIRKDLDDSTIYGGYGADGNLKEIQTKDL